MLGEKPDQKADRRLALPLRLSLVSIMVDDELHQRFNQGAGCVTQTKWSLESSLHTLGLRLNAEVGIGSIIANQRAETASAT